MDIGPVGIWTAQLDWQPAAQARAAVAELEDLGYGAVWVPEAVLRESFGNAGLLLGATSRIVIGTGIANLWFRTPMAMRAGQLTLAEAYPDRFLLGIGASHGPMVEGFLSLDYSKPLTRMREYLDAMDNATYLGPRPSDDPPRVLAALGPKMLALAADRAAGAHPYFVPVEHTAFAREALGDEPLLCPEQAVVLETDPSKAREVARQHMKGYLGLPNYRNNLLRLGFEEEDLSDGATDDVVDAIVTWGDVDSVVGRVRAHHDAGADHVAVQLLPADPKGLPIDGWRALAPALGTLPGRTGRPARSGQ